MTVLINGVRVYDMWWPYRMGVVMSVEKTGLHVKWSDGEVMRYDKSHMKFLRKCDAEYIDGGVR